MLQALVLLSLLSSAPRPLLITVDDLPMAGKPTSAADRKKVTQEMLAALARHEIKAVAFVNFGKVKGPDDLALLDLWRAGGHELGNHSYSHPNYSETAIEAYLEDVDRGARELDAYLASRKAAKSRFFRFPFLAEGDTPEKVRAMRDYLAKSGVRNVTVTIDNQDWWYERPFAAATQNKDTKEIQRITRAYHAALELEVAHHERRGDKLLGRVVPQVLLLHAGSIGASAWDQLFTSLKQSDHRFANADEVLADPALTSLPDFVSSSGFGLFDRLRAQQERLEASTRVKSMITAQADAWNRGDLVEFTNVYAEDAVFVSPDGVTRGRQPILDRYRKKYSTKEKMGHLSFEFIDVRVFAGEEVTLLQDAVPSSVHGVSVIMKWKLDVARGGKALAAGSSMVELVPVGDGYRIVQDASM